MPRAGEEGRKGDADRGEGQGMQEGRGGPCVGVGHAGAQRLECSVLDGDAMPKVRSRRDKCDERCDRPNQTPPATWGERHADDAEHGERDAKDGNVERGVHRSTSRHRRVGQVAANPKREEAGEGGEKADERSHPRRGWLELRHRQASLFRRDIWTCPRSGFSSGALFSRSAARNRSRRRRKVSGIARCSAASNFSSRIGSHPADHDGERRVRITLAVRRSPRNTVSAAVPTEEGRAHACIRSA